MNPAPRQPHLLLLLAASLFLFTSSYAVDLAFRCGICLTQLQFVPAKARSSLVRSRTDATLGS
jgi:hypothetical protein